MKRPSTIISHSLLRNFLISFFCHLLVLPVFSQKTDAELLGFKGKVSQVLSDNDVVYAFNNEGRATTFYYRYGLRYINAYIANRGTNTFEGKADWDGFLEDSDFDGTILDNWYTLTFANGRPNKLKVKCKIELEEGFSNEIFFMHSEQIYQYNEDGEEIAISFDSKLVSESNSNLNAKWDKTKFEFKNYTYDEHGNWVSRDIYLDGYYHANEKRTIVYRADYLSEIKYQKALAEEDYETMKSLAEGDETVSPLVRQMATEVWNGHIAAEIDGKYKYQWDKLHEIMVASSINEANRVKIEKILRQHVWDTQVVGERDYKKLADLESATFNGWAVFDQEYRQKIRQRSQQLRNDSVAGLYQKACDTYNKSDYGQTITVLNHLLNIAPENKPAAELLQGANFQMLQNNIQSGSVNELMFTDFLNEFPQSRYQTQVEDMRVEYLLAQLPYNRTYENIEYVKGLPVNNKSLIRKVKRITSRQEFILNRGRCVQFGFGGNVEAGEGPLAGYGEIGLRIGYIANVVNLYVGARFGQMSHFKPAFDKRDSYGEYYDGYVKLLRATVPMQLRINFAKNYERAWYLGVGADVNFNINPKIVDKTLQSTIEGNLPGFNKEKMVNRISYSPRASLGVGKKHFNFEIYGLYDLTETFDNDYIEQNGINNYMHPKMFFEQRKNQWRLGAALRIFL